MIDFISPHSSQAGADRVEPPFLQLGLRVAQNVLAFDRTFWLHLAARAEAAQTPSEQVPPLPPNSTASTVRGVNRGVRTPVLEVVVNLEPQT